MIEIDWSEKQYPREPFHPLGEDWHKFASRVRARDITDYEIEHYAPCGALCEAYMRFGVCECTIIGEMKSNLEIGLLIAEDDGDDWVEEDVEMFFEEMIDEEGGER